MSVTARRKSLYGFEYGIDTPDFRRADPKLRKEYEIKSLWQRTHEVLRLALLGHTEMEIAKVVGMKRATVGRLLNSQLCMEKLSAMRLSRDQQAIDVAAEVTKLYPKALKVYESILDNENAALSLRKETADTIVMDIGGHRAPKKIQQQVSHSHLVRAEIEAIKARGIEAARASGMLIDIEPNNINDTEEEE